MVPQDKKDAIVNLYASNIDVEFISMQVDLDIPTVITVLRELGVNQENKKSTWLHILADNINLTIQWFKPNNLTDRIEVSSFFIENFTSHVYSIRN